jgi:tetratricopeptide (TPR) repeat protein
MMKKTMIFGSLFLALMVSEVQAFGGMGGRGGGGRGGGLGARAGGGGRSIGIGGRPGGGRPGYGRPVRPGRPGGGWYHGRWRWRHNRWRRGWRYGSWAYDSGYYEYANPYAEYEEPEKKPEKVEPGSDEAKKLAEEAFDEARDAFGRRAYGNAFSSVSKALRLMPGTKEYLEFRALVNFAQRRYNQAAADLHRVLASGPGWDWATMMALYKRKSSYETHLRNLEKHCKSKPKEAASHLVLAYHYLTATHTDAAKRELEALVRLTPDDPIAKDLLAMIEAPEEEAEPEEEKPVPPLPKSFRLKGSWTATKPNGDKMAVSIAEEGKFTWKVTSKDGTRDYSGEYALEGCRILLEDPKVGGLIGRIAPDGDDAFVFRVEGKDEEAGLRFERVK